MRHCCDREGLFFNFPSLKQSKKNLKNKPFDSNIFIVDVLKICHIENPYEAPNKTL